MPYYNDGQKAVIVQRNTYRKARQSGHRERLWRYGSWKWPPAMRMPKANAERPTGVAGDTCIQEGGAVVRTRW